MSGHLTVVQSTGEVVELDRSSAERRAQQIETRLAAVGESFTIALTKIREAIEHRDDIALGYRSPGDYVSARFGKALAGLPVEMRREAVRELTDAGMSTRAIAPIVGVGKSTVDRDQVSHLGHVQVTDAGESCDSPGDDDQMPHQSYVCPNCDAHMGIAGGTGTDEDWDTQDYFRSEIERHESGECTPQTPAPTIPPGEPDLQVVAITDGYGKVRELLAPAVGALPSEFNDFVEQRRTEALQGSDVACEGCLCGHGDDAGRGAADLGGQCNSVLEQGTQVGLRAHGASPSSVGRTSEGMARRASRRLAALFGGTR